MQLFCFSYAGGTANFFNSLDEYLRGISVNKFEYSGHGKRHKEPFYKNMHELALDAVKYIESGINLLNDEYAILGYSMGSIAVAEILKIIIDKNILLPKHIFLAAHEPKLFNEIEKLNIEYSDDFIKDRTIKFGGVPTSLINNKIFWRTYLPVLRSDYLLISKYDFNLLQLNIKIPTTVFYSESDTPLSEMEKWKNFVTGEIEFICYKGNHFFIYDHVEDICNVIKSKIMR